MSNLLKKYGHVFLNYHKFPIKVKKTIVKNTDSEFVKCLSEICYNLVRKNVKITKAQRRRLLRFKRCIKTLACKARSNKLKKKYIQQKGFGFLPLLISIIAPLLGSLIGRR